MALTMSDEQERSLRDRGDRTEYNFPAFEVWAELDATRAKLAEAVQERERRDENTVAIEGSGIPWNSVDVNADYTGDCVAEKVRRASVALAASQAECAELRAALSATHNALLDASLSTAAAHARHVLSRAPGSVEALRAMLTSEVAVEAVARVEHEQWRAWAGSLIDSEPGLSPERIERWRALFVHYEELTHEMKDRDREWAKLALAAIVARLLPDAPKEPTP